MHSYILQTIKPGRMQEYAWLARELIEAENAWRIPEKGYSLSDAQISYQTATLEQLETGIMQVDENIVPVGSLEFCSAALRQLGLSPVTAINIPSELRDEEYTGRFVYTIQDFQMLETLFALQNHWKHFFIKPDDYAKRFETIRINKSGLSIMRNIPGPYFLSAELTDDIIAEWRLFFDRKRIIDARPYILDRWVCPKREFAENILQKWTHAPTAGTLDIAILKNGRNILLETHQFLSCGLYGFEERILLQMFRDAWHWELQAQKERAASRR